MIYPDLLRRYYHWPYSSVGCGKTGVITPWTVTIIVCRIHLMLLICSFLARYQN